MMKKVFVLILVLTFVLLTGCSQATANNQNKITKEQAEKIALDYAELTADKVTRLHTEYDYDDDRRIFEYDVEFDYNGEEYDYEINAETGEIIHFDKERDN